MQCFVELYSRYCTVVEARKKNERDHRLEDVLQQEAGKSPSLEVHESCISGCFWWLMRASFETGAASSSPFRDDAVHPDIVYSTRSCFEISHSLQRMYAMRWLS